MSPSYEYYPHTKAAPPDPRDARIAALEATVARLTAPVTDGEVVDMVGTYFAMRRGREAGRAALTAFLERRIKG